MSDAAVQQVKSGARVIAIEDSRLAWWEGDELVVLQVREGKLLDLRAAPFTALPVDWEASLVAPADAPLLPRARAIYTNAARLVAGLTTERWLALGTDYLLRDATLGLVRVFGSGFARVRTYVLDDVYARLWSEPDAALVDAPPALAPVAATFIATVRTWLAQLDAGTHALYYGDPLVAFDGRYVDVDLEALPKLLFNPFARMFTRAKVIDLLSERFDHPDEIKPVPPGIADAFPAIRAALQQTRAQVVDHYVAEIRAGTRTISGGPTTDQSWTVRSRDGATFTISGYGDAGPTEDPLTEEALREMLSTYAMFGLADLPA